MKKIVMQCSDSSYVICIKPNSECGHLFFTAEQIILSKKSASYFPSVVSYDDIQHLKQIGIFAPRSTEERMLLQDHNLQHYNGSKKAHEFHKSSQTLDMIETINKEIKEMNELGIAFKK